MKYSYVAVLLTICVFANISKANNWDYQHQAKWYDDFDECSLDHQSPVEINARDAIDAFFMPPVKFFNYSVVCPAAATISNTGYSASITLSEQCNRPQIKSGPLAHGTTYEAVSFHFHWGSKDQHGSEHIINSARYSMEAHIVHKNTMYPTMAEAGKHQDGLAVAALFYKSNVKLQTFFNGLQNVVVALKNIRKFNTKSFIHNTTLSALFGSINTNRFYTYQGSLTTPPCSQAVTWIVFPQVIEVNSDQLHQFRLLSDIQGAPLVNNYRFIQPKGKRKIYFRHDVTDVVPTIRPPATPGPNDGEYMYYDYTDII